jgi:hypothetical protein
MPDDQAYLDGLYAARRALLTGAMETQISFENRSVRLKEIDPAALNAEIMRVETKLGLRPQRRALKPYF